MSKYKSDLYELCVEMIERANDGNESGRRGLHQKNFSVLGGVVRLV